MTSIRGTDELEALFAAGYAERAVRRYELDARASAGIRAVNELAGESLARLRMGLPPRTPDERDAYLMWGRVAALPAAAALPSPDWEARRQQLAAALAEREARFQQQVAANPPPPAELVLYPEDAGAQASSAEALARLHEGLPPRDEGECRTYWRWSRSAPGARRYRELVQSQQTPAQRWPFPAEQAHLVPAQEPGLAASDPPEPDVHSTVTADHRSRHADFYIPWRSPAEQRHWDERQTAGAVWEHDMATKWDMTPAFDRGPDVPDPVTTEEFNAELERLDLDPHIFEAQHPGWQFLAPEMKARVIEGLESELAQIRELSSALSPPSTLGRDISPAPDREAEALARIAKAGEQDRAPEPSASADTSAPPVADSLPSGTSQRVRAVCPPCGLDWEGPAQAWDDHFSDRHARDHQKGTGGLSASAPLSVERRTTNEAVTGADASQLETAALTQIARAREQDRTHDHAPEPPI